MANRIIYPNIDMQKTGRKLKRIIESAGFTPRMIQEYEYCDGDGNVICEFLEVGENWKNQQETLLVDTETFSKKMENTEYKPFGVYRELREPSLKASERFGDKIYCRFDRTFIVWFDE